MTLAGGGSGVSRGPRKELNGKETGKVTLLPDYSNLLYLLIMYFISSAWGGDMIQHKFDVNLWKCKCREAAGLSGRAGWLRGPQHSGG